MKVSVETRRLGVPGFRFAGVACGIKPSKRKDVAVLVSDVPAVAVAAFTTNRIKAAPILIGQERVRTGRLQAIVVNSGNANASTGEPGRRLARDSCSLVGRSLGIDEGLVLPSSTGKIGLLPPWDKLRNGILRACSLVSPAGFWDAASAIMTTDAFPKVAVRRLSLDGKKTTIMGMAKGAGMINPKLATMLCYILTDARVTRPVLQRILEQTVAESFNAISVDGDTSTNDTLAILANGVAGNRAPRSTGPAFRLLRQGVGEVASELARMCVKDGEGASRVIDIFVRGAPSSSDAELVARAVGYSPLVKTAFAGGDPNWGRIACAVGYAGAHVNPDTLEILVGTVPIGRNGLSTGAANEKRAARVMARAEFSVTIDLHLGSGSAHLVTSDLTVEYVRFNAEYSS